MKKFADDFIFGGATAAYQVEGGAKEDGRGPCCWDEYLSRPGSRFNGDVASDFYHKYKDDLHVANQFGVNGIRISISWSRVISDGSGEVNHQGLAYYNGLIDECLANGVDPFVTLHHFDTPQSLFQNGDWLNRENIDHFVRYAKVCFDHFGDRVKKWATFNEPWAVAQNGYIIGNFPPSIQYDIPKAVQIMHNMMIAHARVLLLYKSMNLPGEIGIVHTLEGKCPISDKPEDQRAAYLDDMLANRFMLDACFKGGYEAETLATVQDILMQNRGSFTMENGDMQILREAAQKIDFLGMNYYSSHFLQAYEGESRIYHNGTGEKGTSVFGLKGIGARVGNPEVETTDWDWPIYPQGMYNMLHRIKREYPNYKKIYITENGMGYKDDFIDGKIDDTPRIEYIYKHLEVLLKAIQEGVVVKGYYVWSLLDMLSWSNGFNKRYGLFYVDFATQQRYPKKSAFWYKKMSQTKRLLKGDEIQEF
ncbi:6-phospho-beta-galactosidase [Propionispora sp. 2/2-37]|uniref:6-phospho-beta-galactosidase n=1 Tax=Propionispora sp. 2/2-37 TaxID=1677858 RepID=UPI0006BB78C1|nr:6-phospho-beta-galactosidase [Propionispora sp. 2/2-37]CUH94993.1 6-phospho-beta-galactosidase [Propionispora sp. 2/2-37]